MCGARSLKGGKMAHGFLDVAKPKWCHDLSELKITVSNMKWSDVYKSGTPFKLITLTKSNLRPVLRALPGHIWQ